MLSVIPILLGALVVTGGIGALWQLWSARPSSPGSGTSAPDPAGLRVLALTKLVWAMFLLIHAVLLLLLSESREVPEVFSICASGAGALAFLAAFVALLSAISLERRGRG